MLHIVKFIILLSTLILFGCTNVDNLDQYDALYEKYVSTKYENSEHADKMQKASEYIYSRGYDDFFSRFHPVRHRHILMTLCGRYANLLQGDYNKEMAWANLPTHIHTLRYNYNWKENIFVLAQKTSNEPTNPMFQYAKKFLTSPNGMTPKTQIADLISTIDAAITMPSYGELIKKVPQFCTDIQRVYNIMESF
ncbi:hypothetical protein [Bartonella sp. 1-1C]|uniref:hypothetical protein n=1 Tax=Bartonella sp. 1-1C TaxID=515256 RepID=UPI0001F4CC7E|nr:hypothetical protein [Bartonella sp. 1-1C]ATO57817.1 hypothetical protein B11Cv2_010610 [Bartonella sp. 1-1C]CBI80397.1 conserved exported hypothetical protein [Bartonella sp. 1-1C]